jgi:hypothetical protein
MVLLYILIVIVLFNKELIADTSRCTLVASVSLAIQLKLLRTPWSILG